MRVKLAGAPQESVLCEDLPAEGQRLRAGEHHAFRNGLPHTEAHWVIFLHVMGMFIPSFFTGNLIQRFGVTNIMFCGIALLLGGVAAGLLGMSEWNFRIALAVNGASRHKSLPSIPSAIEAGTFVIAAAITGGELEVAGCLCSHLTSILSKLRETNVVILEEAPDRLRVRGANPEFAAYGGVPLGRQSLIWMFSGGAMGGLVGAILVLGVQYRYTDGALLSPGYTWTGLMAALLAKGSPSGTTIAAVGFAALQIGGFVMDTTHNPPPVTS